MKKYSKRLKIREARALDLDKVISAPNAAHAANRKVTSILLEDEVVKALKTLADNREVSYQSLVRGLILEGLKRVPRVS